MSDVDPMDWADFADIATALVNGIMDRIPEQWREGFVDDLEIRIQEPRIFMRNLMLVLTEDRVPITRAEADTMIRLMKHRRIDASVADRFNVVEAPSS